MRLEVKRRNEDCLYAGNARSFSVDIVVLSVFWVKRTSEAGSTDVMSRSACVSLPPIRSAFEIEATAFTSVRRLAANVREIALCTVRVICRHGKVMRSRGETRDRIIGFVSGHAGHSRQATRRITDVDIEPLKIDECRTVGIGCGQGPHEGGAAVSTARSRRVG